MEEVRIDSLSERFENHLSIEGNNRILVSGKFGLGKTYFLNRYFDSRKEHYNKFIISPVNYSVSKNEDIIELIKADIVKELFLRKMIDLDKLPEDTGLQKISKKIEDRSSAVGRFILNNIPKLDTTNPIPAIIIEAINKIFPIKKEGKIKNSKDRTISEEISDQWFETANQIGHIYEHNYITKLINIKLQEIKSSGKKNVLIVDDLDRMDPEHIFRILNILSAHNNQFETDNKYLFDYVIIVCDVENIKKIYSHKYGEGVDFEGYIDKFYTTEFFLFENKDAINEYVSHFSDHIVDETEKAFYHLILQVLHGQNLVTLRKLLKHNMDYSIPEYYPVIARESEQEFSYYELGTIAPNVKELRMSSRDMTILRFLKLMSFVFGSHSAFMAALNEINDTVVFENIEESEMKSALLYLAFQLHLASAQKGISVFYKIRKAEIGGGRVSRYGHRYQLIEAAYPSVQVRAIRFKIITIWSTSNMYDGSKSFFSDRFVETDGFNDKLIAEGFSTPYSFSKLLIHLCENLKKQEYLKLAGIV